MLKKFYNLLNYEGVLVLETATTRNNKLSKTTAIEIQAGGQYHFPTKKALSVLILSIFSFLCTHQALFASIVRGDLLLIIL